YFPLFHGHDDDDHLPAPAPCALCRDGKRISTTAYAGSAGGISTASPGAPSTSSAATSVSASPPTTSSQTPTTEAVAGATPKPAPPAQTPAGPPAQTPTKPVTSQKPAAVSVVVVPKSTAPPEDAGGPWRSALAFCLGGMLLHAGSRALRRQVTLRHLVRPL